MSDDQKRDSVSDHTSQANDARAPKETPNEQSTQDQSQAEHSEAPRRPDQNCSVMLIQMIPKSAPSLRPCSIY